MIPKNIYIYIYFYDKIYTKQENITFPKSLSQEYLVYIPSNKLTQYS